MWQEFIDKIKRKLSFDRLDKLYRHYTIVVEECSATNSKEKEEIAYFKERFENYYAPTKRLSRIRTLLYLVLIIGSSAAFSSIKLIPYLSVIVEIIALVGALFGIFIFAFIFVLNAKINLNIQIMQSCMMHLVVIYQKNQKRDTKDTLAKFKRVI